MSTRAVDTHGADLATGPAWHLKDPATKASLLACVVIAPGLADYAVAIYDVEQLKGYGALGDSARDLAWLVQPVCVVGLDGERFDADACSSLDNAYEVEPGLVKMFQELAGRVVSRPFWREMSITRYDVQVALVDAAP